MLSCKLFLSLFGLLLAVLLVHFDTDPPPPCWRVGNIAMAGDCK
jgi:hypothetical protein